MAPASNEEQFKFLISCIRYSNNGKVDFGQVARECRIVSKGAAAKRYERMMKSHGIAPNAASIKAPPIRTMKTERGNSSFSPVLATSKKRKADAFLDENNAADDDERFGTIKVEQNGIKEQFMVKEEGEHLQGALSLEEAANLLQYYDPPPSYDSRQLGADINYNRNDYDAHAGYHTQIDAPLGMQVPQPFNYTSPYSTGMGGIPRSGVPSPHYQPMVQYQGDEQGHSDNPLIVD